MTRSPAGKELPGQGPRSADAAPSRVLVSALFNELYYLVMWHAGPTVDRGGS